MDGFDPSKELEKILQGTRGLIPATPQLLAFLRQRRRYGNIQSPSALDLLKQEQSRNQEALSIYQGIQTGTIPANQSKKYPFIK